MWPDFELKEEVNRRTKKKLMRKYVRSFTEEKWNKLCKWYEGSYLTIHLSKKYKPIIVSHTDEILRDRYLESLDSLFSSTAYVSPNKMPSQGHEYIPD